MTNKCHKCLHGARVSVTGVNPCHTLKMDMGSAVLYVVPNTDGTIEVILNSENLIDGDYAYCVWDGSDNWNISTARNG